MTNLHTIIQHPTKWEQIALGYDKLLFYEPACHNQCTDLCLIHTTPNTLTNDYTNQNQHIHPRPQQHTNHPLHPTHLEHPKPPLYILKDCTHFPIYLIANNRTHKYKYKYKILKNIYILPMPIITS